MTRNIDLALATYLPRKPIPGFGVLDTSTTNVRARFGDIDIYMHVNNSKYLAMMDAARSNMIADMGGMKTLNRLGWYPVVAASAVKYRASMKLGQRAQIETRVVGWDERICYLSQVIKRGDVVYTEAWIAARFLARKGPKPSPAQVLEALGSTMDSPALPDDMRLWADAAGVLFRAKK